MKLPAQLPPGQPAPDHAHRHLPRFADGMNLRLALESLWQARRRNLVSLVGLAVGVAAVVAILALTLIVRAEALRRFDRSGLDVLTIRPVSRPTSASVRKPPAMDLELATGLARSVPGIERVAPIIENHTRFTAEGRTFEASVLGVTADAFQLDALPVVAGRGLAITDAHQPFAVLGRDQAMALSASPSGGYNPDALLGRELIVGGRVLTVIGVLGPAATGRSGRNPNQAVFVPATTCVRLFDAAAITEIDVQTDGRAGPAEAAAAIRRYFQTRADGLAVEISSAEELVREMERQLRLFAVLLGGGGALAFALGGAGMMNGMLAAVLERRREIGLRRALGAWRGDIQAQFLCEALMLGAIGGALGLALGLGATAAIARANDWRFVLFPGVPLAGFAAALLLAVAAGFFPARQAARLDPTEAMEAES